MLAGIGDAAASGDGVMSPCTPASDAMASPVTPASDPMAAPDEPAAMLAGIGDTATGQTAASGDGVMSPCSPASDPMAAPVTTASDPMAAPASAGAFVYDAKGYTHRREVGEQTSSSSARGATASHSSRPPRAVPEVATASARSSSPQLIDTKQLRSLPPRAAPPAGWSNTGFHLPPNYDAWPVDDAGKLVCCICPNPLKAGCPNHMCRAHCPGCPYHDKDERLASRSERGIRRPGKGWLARQSES